MAKIINIPTFSDERGNLTVIEKVVPFPIKRIFFIYDANNATRGGHRHHKTKQVVFCIRGSCVISNNDGNQKEDFLLNAPSFGLILYPEDWHLMHHFTKDSILMVLASEFYDPQDYILEEYA